MGIVPPSGIPDPEWLFWILLGLVLVQLLGAVVLVAIVLRMF